MTLNAHAQSIALWLEAIGHVGLGDDIPLTGIEHLLDSLKGSTAFHNPRLEHHPEHGPMIAVLMDAPKHRPDEPHQRWFSLADIASFIYREDLLHYSFSLLCPHYYYYRFCRTAEICVINTNGSRYNPIFP